MCQKHYWPYSWQLIFRVIFRLTPWMFGFLVGCSNNIPIELSLDCGSNGGDREICLQMVKTFEEKEGIKVNVIVAPANTSLHLSVLQELASTHSTIDVYMIDVIWPGILADGLLDLNDEFTKADLDDFFPRIIENNTINGKIKAIPWFTDAGLLYYRKDLIKKYGFYDAPETWDDLTRMAKVIQAGERRAGKANFWGFLWQGRPYEGLTCAALEWVYSAGGGSIVDAKGNVTINNPQAIKALDMARGWIGSISPPTTPQTGDEEWARLAWQQGNAAFMRNWPYAYSRGNDRQQSKIVGLFDVAPLPLGNDGTGAATLGGWQLGVSKYSRFPQAAIKLVKYLTSFEGQKFRAIKASYNPTRRSLYQDSQVFDQNPFFGRMTDILNNAVARPSSITASRYDEVSTAFHSSVNQVLLGKSDSASALKALETNLNAIKGGGW
jgi:trehalose/maltose transport system substrate-binding protein